MGTLDIGTAASLMLMSDAAMYNLSGADGKWQVPEGRYTSQYLLITKTDAGGKVWTLICHDMGPLAKFEVRGGETASIQIGPPLALKVDADEPPSGGNIVLTLNLVGKAGERYPVAPRKGTEQALPPKVKVLDASGNVLAEGKSEFTCFGCRYSWRVPEGFKGKYRVEVEVNAGPFEVTKPYEVWLEVK
jgi:hypothetical protein